MGQGGWWHSVRMVLLSIVSYTITTILGPLIHRLSRLIQQESGPIVRSCHSWDLSHTVLRWDVIPLGLEMCIHTHRGVSRLSLWSALTNQSELYRSRVLITGIRLSSLNGGILLDIQHRFWKQEYRGLKQDYDVLSYSLRTSSRTQPID